MKNFTPSVLNLFFLFILINSFLMAQSPFVNKPIKEVVYGNEWIDYEKDYYKIKVPEDGLYRIGYQILVDAGIPMETHNGDDFVLQAYGEEVPIFVSSSTILGDEDYIEFYGLKNRGEVDKGLYSDPEAMQLNPEYSLFNDTMVYFLSIVPGIEHKRTITLDNDLSGSLPDPVPYYMAEEKVVYHSDYHKPTRHSETRYGHFDIGDGFGYPTSTKKQFSIKVDNIFPSGEDPQLSLRMGSNFVNHVHDIFMNDTLLSSKAFSLFEVNEYNLSFPIDKLKTNNKIKIEGNYVNDVDRFVLSFLALKYPRTFVSDDDYYFEFNQPDHLESKYIEIDFPSVVDENYIVYNKKNNLRLVPFIDVNENRIKLLLTGDLESRDLAIFHETIIHNVSKVEKRSFTDIKGINVDYLILTSEKLRNDTQNEDWPQNYADFRSSIEGGEYSTTVINVEDLYDQFSFGIERHSIAISNMGLYIHEHWRDFKFAFIIGKGLELNSIRRNEDIVKNQHLFYVPTFGQTPSDNLLFTIQGEVVPFVPVGRIAVTSTEQIKDYLNKVKEHANVTYSIPIEGNKLWTKKILHLGGGTTNIKEAIKNYLIGMENEIESNKFGGDITGFYKRSSEIVEELPSERIIDIINEGAAIITFFGHSAVGTLDYSLEQADAYDNKGRYPIFLSLGCLSGNIHTTGTGGVNEDFVLTKDKGSVMFLASSGSAFVYVLNIMAKEFYHQIGEESYGKTIGEALIETYKKMDINNYNFDILLEEQTFHGDPALTLYPKQTPDYTFDYNSLVLEPSIVNAAQDSFAVNIDIQNLGRSRKDSFYISIIHTNPKGDTLYNQEIQYHAPSYIKKIKLVIPLEEKDLIGENHLYLHLDSKNSIEEVPNPIGEDNNELMNDNGMIGYSFYIIDNNLMPIYPQEFGIVSDPEISLKASSSNVFIEEQKYILQIDTSELFETVIEETEITQGGGLIEWNPNLKFENDQVYYWRVSPDSLDPEIGYVWNNSSFIYLEDEEEGWNQSHYFQFKKDDFGILELLDDRSFVFDTNFIENIVTNVIPGNGGTPKFTINGNLNKGGYQVPGYSTLVFTVVDSSGRFWVNISGNDYESKGPWGYATGFYYDIRTPEGRLKVKRFLEDHVPPKSYIYAYTFIKNEEHSFNTEEWAADSLLTEFEGGNLFNIFEERGATLIRQLEEKGTVPYTFIFQNGYGKLEEKIAEDKKDIIICNFAIEGIWHEGELKSKPIGPASEWNNLNWDETLSFDGENDTTFITILGLDMDQKIIDTLLQNQSQKAINLDFIDGNQYPFIQLIYYCKDEVDKTTAQLEYWRVRYKKVPELAFFNNSNSMFHADSIYQGDILKHVVNVKNLSEIDIDSVLVKYIIKAKDNTEIVSYKKIAGPKSFSDIQLDYNFDTRPLTDNFTFEIELNPDRFRVEQYHFNNLGLKKVKLLKDEINPLLDVRFDGIHIMDHDIVSPNTNIRIQLKDNSPFMLTDNSDQFRIELKYPNGEKKSINFNNNDDIFFFPAKDASNLAYIEFKPNLLTEGEYKIRIRARDASYNSSGENDYQVSFNIVLEQKITNLINYPNPFSTSTQFIFNLTGSELPQNFKIQIMTASGKVVKEIEEGEFGDLHIGLNKSIYKWDGTDDFGEKLGNGVYFYKVYMQNIDGENYEHIESSIDSYFTNGWGKMVILR